MKEQILSLLERILNVPEGTMDEETTADEIESWDSLNHVLIIGALEEELDISIPLDEAAEISSVAELLEKAGVS